MPALIKINPSALKETKWHEYALRFVTGGIVTVIAGIIAQKWGPGIGGLFLAFPAIFPASATLIEKHERQRKQDKGLHGESAALMPPRSMLWEPRWEQSALSPSPLPAGG
jgi:hypothetical protein